MGALWLPAPVTRSFAPVARSSVQRSGDRRSGSTRASAPSRGKRHLAKPERVAPVPTDSRGLTLDRSASATHDAIDRAPLPHLRGGILHRRGARVGLGIGVAGVVRTSAVPAYRSVDRNAPPLPGGIARRHARRLDSDRPCSCARSRHRRRRDTPTSRLVAPHRERAPLPRPPRPVHGLGLAVTQLPAPLLDLRGCRLQRVGGQ